MQVVISTQPEPLLTHADEIVRMSMGLDGTDRDALADSLLLSAQAELDGPKGKLGFTVAAQSVIVTAASFDDPAILLPGGSTIDNVVVTYLDGDGASQTFDDASYVVAADGTLSLAYDASWPTLYGQENAVSIAYGLTGLDEGDPRIDQMKQAIIMHAKLHMDMDEPEVRRKVIENMTSTLWVPVL